MKYDIARQAGMIGYCAFIVAPGKHYDGYYDADIPAHTDPEKVKQEIERQGHTVRRIDK